MPAAADDASSVAGLLDVRRLRAAGPPVALALVLVLVALQRGGYFAESWGLPTAACAWAVVLVALLAERPRVTRVQLIQLAGMGLLAGLALLSASWAPGGLGSALPVAQLLALYLAALTAVYLLFRRSTLVLVPVWAALALIALLALSGRLFPSSDPGTDSIAGNRLSEPLGYWNSLGLWAAMGLALGIVLAGRANSSALRVAAAVSCVPSAVTLYFTYSRGAWLALAAGLVVAVVLDPRRLGLMAWILLVLSWPALAVFSASRFDGLTGNSPALEHAREDGRRLALVLLALATASGLTTYGAARLERIRPASRTARRAFAGALAVLALLSLCGVVARFGAPWTITANVADRFTAEPRGDTSDLNARLFDASANGRIDLWRVAWNDVERNPITGSGAGSYPAEWFRERETAADATNAHQLYLETLAELGPLGLGLLLVGVGTPLVAAWRARRHPLAAGATAAYVAFLVHAAADWHWQLAAVGLAGLCCGAGLLLMLPRAPRPAIATGTRAGIVLVGVALAGFALWSLQGSYPLGRARDAIDDGDWRVAQARADDAVERVGGFSALAWRLRGEAQTALRRPAEARASLRVAVRRNPSSWQAWYDLAVVTSGAERRAAAAQALALNPHGAETREQARVAGVTPSSP